MLKLRINPIVAKDLKNIRDYIAEDNEEYAAKTIKEIYGKFENLQMFPGMGSDLSKRVSFRTDYKYAIWEDYVSVTNPYLQFVCHLLRPFIYMGFYLVWAISFQKRIIQKEPRRCLIMIAAMMAFWMPFGAYGLSVVYGLAYYLNLPFWKIFSSDMTAALCLLFALIIAFYYPHGECLRL